MNRIAVLDYGMGNLRSVAKALEHVAPEAEVTVVADAAGLARASRVVFPGQGAMPDCMRELETRGLRSALIEASASKPFLGLCVGLQALFEFSEEGSVAGLGLLPGRVERFDPPRDDEGRRLKVPHMGWNQVEQTRAHPIWEGIEDGTRFYFVHSYFVHESDPSLCAGATRYPDRFTSAVARENLFAVQFHPEKSQDAGLALLRNFAHWNP